MKMAVTMLAAWALEPPTLPANVDPTRFLWMFKSTMAATVVLSTSLTTFPGKFEGFLLV